MVSVGTILRKLFAFGITYGMVLCGTGCVVRAIGSDGSVEVHDFTSKTSSKPDPIEDALPFRLNDLPGDWGEYYNTSFEASTGLDLTNEEHEWYFKELPKNILSKHILIGQPPLFQIEISRDDTEIGTLGGGVTTTTFYKFPQIEKLAKHGLPNTPSTFTAARLFLHSARSGIYLPHEDQGTRNTFHSLTFDEFLKQIAAAVENAEKTGRLTYSKLRTAENTSLTTPHICSYVLPSKPQIPINVWANLASTSVEQMQGIISTGRYRDLLTNNEKAKRWLRYTNGLEFLTGFLLCRAPYNSRIDYIGTSDKINHYNTAALPNQVYYTTLARDAAPSLLQGILERQRGDIKDFESFLHFYNQLRAFGVLPSFMRIANEPQSPQDILDTRNSPDLYGRSDTWRKELDPKVFPNFPYSSKLSGSGSFTNDRYTRENLGINGGKFFLLLLQCTVQEANGLGCLWDTGSTIGPFWSYTRQIYTDVRSARELAEALRAESPVITPELARKRLSAPSGDYSYFATVAGHGLNDPVQKALLEGYLSAVEALSQQEAPSKITPSNDEVSP